MFQITKKDKKEILRILLEHDGKCRMSELIREYSYLNDRKTKREKIREVIRQLNKELNQKIKLQIVEIGGWVEIIF